MSDIFISYSRKDSQQALALAERLQAQGMSVWIDQRGIEAAASWSKEIVHAIDGCKSFIVLLSANSLASENVGREVSIASDSKKKMLPIALEDVKLTDELRYHLAGIQHVAFSQNESIEHALRSFGIAGTPVKAADARKSLMILPFEDLSPTQDNGWFADGLVSEMIDKLSKIKSLKLVDRQTSLQIKKKGHTIAELAKILEVRYFIEGSIRKFGEQIKISSALLDFETGDYLWQDTHKGVFAEIFQIQEDIADKVVQGLKLHLGATESAAVKSKSTENGEAYRYYLEGQVLFDKQSQVGFSRAIQLYTEAVHLDPEFSHGFRALANTHLGLYTSYERELSHLQAAESAIGEVQRIEGESAGWCWINSVLHRLRGEYVRAEHFARLAFEKDVNFHTARAELANILLHQNRLDEALLTQREYTQRNPTPLNYFSLLVILSRLGDKKTLASTAVEALSIFERYLRLNPDDQDTAVKYASVLCFALRREEASAHAYVLSGNISLDAAAQYNLACLFTDLHDNAKALEMLQRCVERGFSNIELFLHDPDLDPLRELPEFKAVLSKMELKVATQLTVTTEPPTP
jgi:adenylate cyclase